MSQLLPMKRMFGAFKPLLPIECVNASHHHERMLYAFLFGPRRKVMKVKRVPLHRRFGGWRPSVIRAADAITFTGNRWSYL